jgi:glycosyltransferase involved in cell wall biosynthesis
VTRPRRVLFINDTARNGGPGRSLHAILSFLDPAEIHRMVLLPREDAIARLLRDAGVVDEFIIDADLIENAWQPWDRAVERDDLDAPLNVRLPRLALNVGRMGRLAFTLPRLVRDRGVELIYCNGTTADFVGGIVGNLTGTPVIWHVRYTSIPAASRALHGALARSRQVKRIVCVSNASAALFPGLPEKVAVVHNAVDVERYRRDATPGGLRGSLVPEDAFIYGSMGRILPRKGYPHMIRAARELLDRCAPEERHRPYFVVLGDTPADLPGDHLEECRALVKELGLEGRFLFPGFTEDVRPWLQDFDVVVLPSVYPDPLPRTVIEGMAYERPVVAFDVGGVGEMVRDGATGTLLPPSPSTRLFADAMLAYLRDPERLRREGIAAREAVIAGFGGNAHGRAIQAQIERALT